MSDLTNDSLKAENKDLKKKIENLKRYKESSQLANLQINTLKDRVKYLESVNKDLGRKLDKSRDDLSKEKHEKSTILAEVKMYRVSNARLHKKVENQQASLERNYEQQLRIMSERERKLASNSQRILEMNHSSDLRRVEQAESRKALNDAFHNSALARGRYIGRNLPNIAQVTPQRVAKNDFGLSKKKRGKKRKNNDLDSIKLDFTSLNNPFNAETEENDFSFGLEPDELKNSDVKPSVAVDYNTFSDDGSISVT